jgi:hypothetical protein
MYRFANVLVHKQPGDEGTVSPVPILLGANMGTATLLDPPPDCSQVGDDNIWTRADGGDEFQSNAHAKLGFIRAGVESYNGSCREGSSSLGGPADFAQCWGNPCKKDKDCDDAEYCRTPAGASRDASCAVCQGSCDCIIGECLPGPNSSLGEGGAGNGP